MVLPVDYLERVYAGVLGKIIGVYLGRPFEGGSYEQILEGLGKIWYYVHEKRGVPLIVTDDDITGTFTFLRAMPDHGNSPDLTAAQIGHSWMNYLIEERTILWWGGLGNSTEHTAFLRMKHGIEAPMSGSIEVNSQVVAEQIGAQIFIDGWAMIAPNDPQLAADLARRAASVSHDGEAIYGAQVLAAMESLAFVETDLDTLLDVGLSVIPADSVIARMIGELRKLRKVEPDWQKAFEWLRTHYGYDSYGGNVHMVPNHGLMILSLLYGEDDFQKTLMIVNTCGWDTDCNSGNIGCLMGIKNGLAGLETGPDYRGPVEDRLYLPTADSGSAISDAVTQAVTIANIGRALHGQAPLAPKNGARFHFDLPGAVQNFRAEESIESKGTMTVENVLGHSASGTRSLGLHYTAVAEGRPARAATATWLLPEAVDMPGYGMMASPTLYPGQTVRARVEAAPTNGTAVSCRLYLRHYGAEDALVRIYGPETLLSSGADHTFDWQIPGNGGYPIAELGVELTCGSHRRSVARANGTVYLDYVTWEGVPDVVLTRTESGTMWRRAWVNGVDDYNRWSSEPFRLMQNEGTGLLIHGTRQWTDYRVTADVTPHAAASAGLAARVQGMRRYYALMLCTGGTVRLVRAVANTLQTLAEADMAWALDHTYTMVLEVEGSEIRGFVDGEQLFTVEDDELPCGGVALVVEEGRTATQAVSVSPL